MFFLIRLLVNTLALLLVVHVVPGLRIDNWQTALLAALGLGFVNSVIRPVVIFLTLPLNMLTLGLLTFFINALLFYSVTAFVPGFRISGFAAAFFGSILFSLISAVLNAVVGPSRINFFSYRSPRDRDGRHGRRDVIDVEGKREDEK